MAIRIAVIPWARGDVGDVFALAHRGALLAPAITNIQVSLHCPQDHELRVLVKRYDALPSAGNTVAPRTLADEASTTNGEVYSHGFTIAGSPVMSIPDRCCSRSVAPHGVLTEGLLGLARSHSLVLELVDTVPMAAHGAPLQFIVRWDE